MAFFMLRSSHIFFPVTDMWRDRQTAVSACTQLLNGHRLKPDERERWKNLKARRLTRRDTNAGACASLLTGRIPRSAFQLTTGDGESVQRSLFALQVVSILWPSDDSPNAQTSKNANGPAKPKNQEENIGSAYATRTISLRFFSWILQWLVTATVLPSHMKKDLERTRSFFLRGLGARAFYRALAERQGANGISLSAETALMLTWFIMTYLSPLSGWSLGLRTTVSVVAQTAQFFAVTQLSEADVRRMFVGDNSFFETLKRGVQYLGHDTRRAFTEFRALLRMFQVQWPNFASSVRWALTDRRAFRAWIIDTFHATRSYASPATRAVVSIVLLLADMKTTLPIRHSRPEGFLFIVNHPLRARALRASTSPLANAWYTLSWDPTPPTSRPIASSTAAQAPKARDDSQSATASSKRTSRRAAIQRPPRRPPAPPTL
jgi:hypothetical protein